MLLFSGYQGDVGLPHICRLLAWWLLACEPYLNAHRELGRIPLYLRGMAQSQNRTGIKPERKGT